VKESIRSHQDLLVWQRGIDLVVAIYRVSAQWPKSEEYGLTSQVRRAAVSIPANTAEGHGRGSPREFARFLTIARGSLREVDTYLVIATRLQILDQIDFQSLQSLANEIARLLHGLLRSLQADTTVNREP
jgi:four helix bundle protein